MKYKNILEKFSNFFLNILIIVFGIILLISVYTSVQTKILGNDYANFFGYSTFEVQTGSMSGTIDAGDWIVVNLTQDVKLNDIVTYKLENEYITHRIIEVYNGYYVTKGDANTGKDDPIKQNQIIGKVIKTLPNFGVLRKTLFNPSVLIALIITLTLIHFAFKKGDKEKNNKNIFGIFGNKIISLFNKEKTNIKDDGYNITNIKITDESKKIYNIEGNNNDDLEKTSLYRVVSVDSNDIDNKYKEDMQKELVRQIKSQEYTEEDLEKTSLYRIIPVDKEEVDNTLLEIAQNEVKDNKKVVSKEKNEIKQKEELEEEKPLTDIDFELLKGKNVKSKNIIETSIIIREKELERISSVLIDNINANIIKSFINSYIDAKYYDFYLDIKLELSSKTLLSSLEKIMKKTSKNLIENYKGKDSNYKTLIHEYEKAFILISKLEHANNSIIEDKAKERFYKKEISECFEEWNNQRVEYTIHELLKIQKKYDSTLDYIFKRLDTSMFNLDLNQLDTKKNIYITNLKHNVSFSKSYSDYIIDKTYNEGVIAEDKILILLNLLLVNLAQDMLTANFDKNYILYIPSSLYLKEKKYERFLKIIDNKYAKDKVIILIEFKDLLMNKDFIVNVKKMGFKFALFFDKDTIIEEKKQKNIYIADFVFVGKKNQSNLKKFSFISKEFLSNVIYEDLSEKIIDFGGEE